MDRKKTGPFATLRVMEKYSDENNVLTLDQIVDYMERDYEVTADRRTIYDNLAILESFGYEFDRFKAGHRGYNLSQRLFNVDEVVKMMNVLRDSGEYTKEELNEIQNRLSQTFSVSQKKELKKKLS